MTQLTLSFDPGLTGKYRNLTECIAAGVYREGLQRAAGRLDCAPSNLSTMLSSDTARKFGVEDLVEYLRGGDLQPLYWLVETFIPDASKITRAQQLERLNALLLEVRAELTSAKG